MIVNTYTILVLGLICPLVAPPITLEVEEPCNEIELCNEFYTLTTTDGTSIYGGVVEQYTIDDNIYLIIKDHDMPYYFVSLKKTKKNDVYDTNLEGVIAKKVEKIINSTNNLAAMDPEHLKSLSLEEREAIFHEFVVTYGNYSNSCNIFLIINDHDAYYFVSLKEAKETDVYATYLEGVIAKKVEDDVYLKNNLTALEQDHLKLLSFEERQAIFDEFVTTYKNYSNSCTANYSILQKVFKVNLVQFINILNNTMESTEPIKQPTRKNDIFNDIAIIIIIFSFKLLYYLFKRIIFPLKKLLSSIWENLSSLFTNRNHSNQVRYTAPVQKDQNGGK
uniref:Uncharacterized protein LOC114343335 n=1 Tax=Diabrotica virgifera virgifera TaxID=50390 RepID=A0A6P7GVA6_DIAVI